MENQFKHLSDFDLNLMVAKHEMRGQHIKYLPQKNIFGEVFSSEDELSFADQDLYIITGSGKEQEINFCSNIRYTEDLMVRGRINTNFDEIGGGFCSTGAGIFVGFEAHKYKRAITIAYAISQGLLEVEDK